jgi:selenocysteine-specific elongation factor
LSDAILHELCICRFEPPSVGELSVKFGGLAPALLRRLERAGSLERVSDDRYYDREALSGMIETMRSSLDTARIYSPAELREVLGVSRKYLIPFLEFCDRNGVTERSEGGRAVRATLDRG